jgi:hypothetical protein
MTSMNLTFVLFPAKLVYSKDIRLIEVNTTPVLDISVRKRVALKVKSTLDQAVTLQLIGDLDNPMSAPTNIDGSINLPIGNVTTSSAEIGLAPDDWQPFIALQMTTLVAPTVGTITVEIAGQS